MTATERIGMVTYPGSWWRQYLLRAKYLKMRLQRNVYPDVFSLPLFLSERFDLIPMGTRVRPGDYTLLFSELNGTDEQIGYLHQLVRSAGCAVAVIPGPPEILSRGLTSSKIRLIREILRECRYVLAYTGEVAEFFDGMAGEKRSLLIPWPFDYARTRMLGARPDETADGVVRILFNVPIRLAGQSSASPLVMKAALLDVLEGLPKADRDRVSFHTFAYSIEDRDEYFRRGMADSFPIHLERKRGYSSFLRFMGACAGVINYSANGVLGRLAFTAATLDRPGIYSANVSLHRSLFPHSSYPPFDMVRFREAARSLVTELLRGNVSDAFKPDVTAARSIGDFSGNAAEFRRLLER